VGPDRPVAATLRTGAADRAPALAPPWTAPVLAVALGVGAVMVVVAWHATRLDAVDTWVMRWQERADSHAGGLAKLVSATAPVGLMVFAMAVGVALAWLAGRRDAVVLALTAAPAALVVELMLKELVHRTWNGDPALIFPSGHVAVATASALTAVLVLRAVSAAPSARLAAACAAWGLVLVVAVARLVETVHSLTDVLGGAAVGVAVTLGLALIITDWWRRVHPRTSPNSVVGGRAADSGAGQRRS